MPELTTTSSRILHPDAVRAGEPPLTPAQRRVLAILERRLPPEWTIHVTPFLNGLRPDFVALDPQRGIVLIAVDEREFRPEHSYRRMADGRDVWSWYDGRASRWRGIPDHDPVARVRRMEREALDLYLPSLPDDASFTAVLTTVVVFAGLSPKGRITAKDVDEIFAPYREGRSAGRLRHQVITALDALEAQPWPGCDGAPSRFMTDEVARDMTHWLAPSRFLLEATEPLPTNSQQRTIIRRPLPMETGGDGAARTARHRLRGSAGSGKSTVVAARAAELAARGRRVLVLGFNHTLIPILRDMSRRWQSSGAPQPGFDDPQFLNLFTWCGRVVKARNPIAWGQHWDVRDGQDLPIDEMVPMVATVLENEPLQPEETFDAVIVDEAQDFNLEAWNLLVEHAVRPGGEALLVADHTQDIYGRGAWTDKAMAGAGFSGPWAVLQASYRLPANLRDEVVRFIDGFIQRPEKLVPLAPEEQALDLDECVLRWVQADARGAVARAGHEIDMLLKQSRGSDPAAIPLAWSDVVVVTATRNMGEEIVRHLRERGVDVAHTFAGRRSKAGFSMADPRPKVTTIHSFKGAEARSVLVVLQTKDPVLAYAALTRVRKGTGKAFLTVVCTEPKFAEYGAGWPDYVEV